MKEPIISGTWAREILDSRGNPTIEVEIELESGATGWAAVPSGASTGVHEAVELRDGDKSRYRGKGVLQAVENVNEVIAPAIEELDATDQIGIDSLMIELDGTPNKGRLGANAILAVSMAVARAAADHTGLPLYQYLGSINNRLLPLPMINIINGGVHADNNLDIQEFMIVPAGPNSFRDALRAASETFYALKKILLENNLVTSVGDEGGIAPSLSSNREAFDYILKAIESAGYHPGDDIWFCIDAAASEFYNKETGIYTLAATGKKYDSDGLIEYYAKLVEEYPIVAIEDPLAEDDWGGWARMTAALGDKIEIKASEKSLKAVKQQLESNPNFTTQAWLQLDREKPVATVVAMPNREDIQIPVEEQLVVEFCSRQARRRKTRNVGRQPEAGSVPQSAVQLRMKV